MHRGSVVGWGTTLQVGRSRIRFPTRPLDFSIELILPVALWPWGRLSLDVSQPYGPPHPVTGITFAFFCIRTEVPHICGLAGVLRMVNIKRKEIIIKRKKVGFEALTAVTMESTIFWDVTPCSPVEIRQYFGGSHCFHLQCRKVIQASKQARRSQQAGRDEYTSLVTCLDLPFDTKVWSGTILRNVGDLPNYNTSRPRRYVPLL
jgi:hypothetical protein